MAAGATPVRVTESAWLTEPVDGIACVVGTTVAEQLTVDAVPSTITRYNVNQPRGLLIQTSDVAWYYTLQRQPCGLLIQMSRRSVVLRVQSKLGTTRYNVNQPWGLLIQMSWRSVVLRVQSKLGLSAIAAGKCKTRAHTAAEFTNSSVTRVINRL